MLKKFLRIIGMICSLTLFSLTSLIAMEDDFDESSSSLRTPFLEDIPEEQTERAHLTSKQLRENVRAVKAKWWQSVEVISPGREWRMWEATAHCGAERTQYPNHKWEGGYLPKTWCCCFSISRKNNDLVELQEALAPGEVKNRGVVMFREDANEIMQRENEEIAIIYEEEKNKGNKEYKEQKKFLNYEQATYKNYELQYLSILSRKGENIHPKILSELEKADRDKRIRVKREQQRELRRKYEEDGKKPEVQLKRALEAHTRATKEHTEALQNNTKEVKNLNMYGTRAYVY